MIDLLKNITFEYPLFLLLPILYLICNYLCIPKNETIYFPNLKILEKYNKTYLNVVKIIQFIIVLLFAISLSSPIKENIVSEENNKGYELSLLIDASGSMKENNKFNIVKNVVMDFVDKRKKDKLALTIFADFAYVAVPLTYDKKSINSILEKINVGIAGVSRTALYEALFMSSKLFKNSKSKNKIAILLTDGVDNADSIPLKVAINTSKEYGIKVYTIGVGREGYDFNSNVLKKISEETGGKYFSATSNQDLIDIYKNIDKLEKSEIKSNKYIQKTYYFQYVLFLLVLLFASLFILKNRS